MISFNRKVRKPITEPFNLSATYALSVLINRLKNNHNKEINESFSKAMLLPIYKKLGARFIAEFMVEKPYPDVTELERWSDYFKELDVYEISVTNMMEADESCDLFK